MTISAILPPIVRGQGHADKVINFLKPKIDLTYRILEEFTLIGQNITQSLVNGTILRNCRFIDINFSRCDFDGAIFDNCTFTKCKFNDAQFIGAAVSACEFNDCLFIGLHVVDCSFDSVKFTQCDMSGSVFTGCEFFTSKLSDTLLSKSTIILNKYYSCEFINMILGDCTFSMHIVEDCSFENSSINADTLGLLFGLSEDNIKKIKIHYLGQSVQFVENQNLIEDILSEYQSRSWILTYYIASYNFNTIDSFAFCVGISNTLEVFTSKQLLIKRDDAEFIVQILRAQFSKNELPWLCVLRLKDEMRRLLHDLEGKDHSIINRKNNSVLFVFYNNMCLLSEQFQTALVCATDDLSSHVNDIGIIARFTFKNKPETSLEGFFKEILAASTISTCQSTVTISQEKGSFIEILQTSIYALVLFQIVLYLLDGCLVQATKIRSRLQGLVGSNLPKSYKKYEDSLTPDAPLYSLRFLKEAMQILTRFERGIWRPKGFCKGNLVNIDYTDER